jgi:hypothetical protein
MGACHLIVHNPFGPYGKGAHISDASEVARVLAGPHCDNVLRVAPIGESEAAAPTDVRGQGAPE